MANLHVKFYNTIRYDSRV